MIEPMTVLAGLCFLIGLVPLLFVPILGKGIEAWAPEIQHAGSCLWGLAPLGWISDIEFALIAALLATGAVLSWRFRHSVVTAGITWSCSYAVPTSRMQYTASSFAQILVGLFRWALQPYTRRPKRLSRFPGASEFHSDVPDTVLDRAVLPAFRLGGLLFSYFRFIQQGSIQTYLLYIFVTLIVLLLWR
jgi:hypothetical protein